MKIQSMSYQQLEEVQITTVQQGKDFIDQLLQEEARLFYQLSGLHDNKLCDEISSRRYDLRKVRLTTQYLIGRIYLKNKKTD
jgi:hypothetical protein